MSANLGGHSMCLVGFGLVYPNMILDTDNSYGNITVEESSPYIGQTYWKFKNSRTANAGHAGYVYTLRYDAGDPNFDLNWWKFYSVEIPIDSLKLIVPLCLDEDNDGYYNWGIGPKPCSCGENVPDEPDCDDSNSFLGPFSEDFSCSVNCTEFIYNTTDCVILYDTAFIDVTYINQDLIIEDNVDLYIYGELLLHDDVNIYISNGASFILTENSILKGVCDDIYFSGTIIVAPGGEIVFEKNSTAYFNGDGEISIQHGVTLDGAMEFYQGVNLVLNDNDTRIDISGVLNIHDNAQFTFSGDGYIKFSKPGPDSAGDNIFAGTNASFVLEGTGKNDKKMEIQQRSVHFPELAELRFENCKIEMGTSARMQTSLTSPITFENVKITSTTGVYNAHRSFHFYGQPNVTINNCIFENGYHGLYGNLTYGGAPLYISNSTFQNNWRGIQIYNKGLNLDNCTIKNNTDYGIYCQSMSFNSNFTNCTISNNKYGMYYQGSASADVNISNTYIQSNTYDGIRTSGAFDLNMECAFINNNRYGIYANNGTNVRPYSCDLSNNFRTICLDYGLVSLNNKHNQLQALNNGYTLYGSTSMWCGGESPILTARHNRWESNLHAQPIYNDNYKLWVYNCSPLTPVMVEDTLPAYLSCFIIGFPSYIANNLEGNTVQNNVNINTESNLPLINIADTQMPLDEAVNQLSNQIIDIESEENYLNLIYQYSTIIENCSLFEDAEVDYWQNIAYGDVHKLISDFYKFVDYDKTNVNFNAGVEELISINESLLENASIPYTSFIEYSLDIALLNRLREHYTVSISQLESLTNELQFAGSESEYDYVQNWLCHIKVEKLAAEELLTPDEFEFAIENCDLCFSVRNAETSDTISGSDNNYEKAKNDENDIINGNTENNFTISPNPNQGSFNIEFANSCLGCEIRIINSIGQLVKSVAVDTDEKTIKIDGLTTGHYKVICLLNNEIIDTGTVVVQ